MVLKLTLDICYTNSIKIKVLNEKIDGIMETIIYLPYLKMFIKWFVLGLSVHKRL